jgi:hypothetical protein
MGPAPTKAQIEAAAMAIREVVADRAGRGRDWRALNDRVKAEYRAEAEAALLAAAVFDA